MHDLEELLNDQDRVYFGESVWNLPLVLDFQKVPVWDGLFLVPKSSSFSFFLLTMTIFDAIEDLQDPNDSKLLIFGCFVGCPLGSSSFSDSSTKRGFR